MIQMENPLNQLITVKLDDTNYLIWKDEVQTAARSYDLEGFILGSQEVPPMLAQDEDGRQIMNLDYIMHQRLDRMLALLILTSMSPSFQQQLVGCGTALDIWNAIEQIFTSQSTTKIMPYKNQLQTMKKDGRSMTKSRYDPNTLKRASALLLAFESKTEPKTTTPNWA